MDFTADWISQFVTEDFSYGWTHPEIPSDGERAVKQAKRDSSSRSSVISFGSSSPLSLPEYDIKPKVEMPSSGEDFGSGKKRAVVGAPVSAGSREHVIAERKRREKLTQRFIVLSSLLPGLKKLDKASVLGEAARYVKQLQEQVKSREPTAVTSVESVVTDSSKTRISSIDRDPNPSSSSSSNDSFDGSLSRDPLPEIEARFSGKDVLVNVHCRSKQSVVPKILDEIQKLQLSIVNCNSMPFGKSTMVVTVVAKMNDEFSGTTMELVSKIRQSLQTLIYGS